MSTNSEPMPGAAPQEVAKPEKPQAPSHSYLFHHERSFVDGESITKSFSWGEESTLVIDQQCIDALRPTYLDIVAAYGERLPPQEFFPNGLSRQQAAEVLAAQETVFRFNGGFPPDEHALSRNATLYAGKEEVALSSFKGRGALTCVESAALAQQLLSGSQEMTYVSGAADLNDSGQFEMHSFNLIKPADNKYAAAILDIANPIYARQEDGTLQVKHYCAPITAEQLERFKRNETLEVDYGGVKRKYQFKVPGSFSPSW